MSKSETKPQSPAVTPLSDARIRNALVALVRRLRDLEARVAVLEDADPEALASRLADLESRVP